MTLADLVTRSVRDFARHVGRMPNETDVVLLPSRHRIRWQRTVTYPDGVHLCRGCPFLSTNGKAAVAHVTRCEGLAS